MPTTDKSQIEQFCKAARDADAEMSKEEFGRVIGKITKPKPETADRKSNEDQSG